MGANPEHEREGKPDLSLFDVYELGPSLQRDHERHPDQLPDKFFDARIIR